jgi:hypothetical protein
LTTATHGCSSGCQLWSKHDHPPVDSIRRELNRLVSRS